MLPTLNDCACDETAPHKLHIEVQQEHQIAFAIDYLTMFAGLVGKLRKRTTSRKDPPPSVDRHLRQSGLQVQRLDYKLYPHIFDIVLSFCDDHALTLLASTASGIRARADSLLYDYLVVAGDTVVSVTGKTLCSVDMTPDTPQDPRIFRARILDYCGCLHWTGINASRPAPTKILRSMWLHVPGKTWDEQQARSLQVCQSSQWLLNWNEPELPVRVPMVDLFVFFADYTRPLPMAWYGGQVRARKVVLTIIYDPCCEPRGTGHRAFKPEGAVEFTIIFIPRTTSRLRRRAPYEQPYALPTTHEWDEGELHQFDSALGLLDDFIPWFDLPRARYTFVGLDNAPPAVIGCTVDANDTNHTQQALIAHLEQGMYKRPYVQESSIWEIHEDIQFMTVAEYRASHNARDWDMGTTESLPPPQTPQYSEESEARLEEWRAAMLDPQTTLDDRRDCAMYFYNTITLFPGDPAYERDEWEDWDEPFLQDRARSYLGECLES